MLAYLYCAAYTRMTMNESSPTCKQRRITFNDDGSAVGSTRVTSATLHLHVKVATNYTPPITVQALLPPTYCRYQFTDPERMDSLVSVS